MLFIKLFIQVIFSLCLKFLEDHHYYKIQEQDIYKIAPLICSSTQGTSSSPSRSLTPTSSQSSPTSEAAFNSKWPCQACTYLNWPKASKCTQCVTPRPKAVPVLTRDLNQPLSVNVHPAQHQQQGASANIDSRNNSPRNSSRKVSKRKSPITLTSSNAKPTAIPTANCVEIPTLTASGRSVILSNADEIFLTFTVFVFGDSRINTVVAKSRRCKS